MLGKHNRLRKQGQDRKTLRLVAQRRLSKTGKTTLYALPATESAIHPTDIDCSQTHAGEKLRGAVRYLMCDDLKAEIALLEGKNLRCTEIQDAPWGTSTAIPLPGGRAIGLYQPRHETALKLNSR